MQKDFNIEGKARGAEKPVVIVFKSTVTNNSLEIRFNWAGRGTTRIPTRGVYGPLISAISVNPGEGLIVRVKLKLLLPTHSRVYSSNTHMYIYSSNVS